MALSIRPNLEYTVLVNKTTTMTETKTLTLELTANEQEALLNALSTETSKWLDIKCDYLLGNIEGGSYEGANILYTEAKGLRDKVKVLVSQLS